jgi:hypothetical protein
MQANAHGEGQENGLLKETVDELKANINIIGNLTADIPFALNRTKLLADSGYHSENNLLNLAEEGVDAYVADNKFRKRDPRFSDANRFKPSKKKNQKNIFHCLSRLQVELPEL